MARPKEYNKKEVLAAATELFWTKGYHGTSLSELVSATKLNKQSMYQEFGNKAGLFEACLDYYSIEMGRKRMTILTQQPLCLQNIKDLFTEQINYLSSNDFKGCMFINTANEIEHIESKALHRVQFFFDKLEEGFLNCLKTEFNASDAHIRATYLVHLFSGIMTVGKAKSNHSYGKSLIDFALQSLERQ